MLNAPIILLKDGTDTSQGKGQIISNINACSHVVDMLRTTLGPRGMDKLLHMNDNVTITNDGATVMQTLQVAHPAARILVDVSLAQDAEVGDGTTSVVLLAGELLHESKKFIEEGMHPQVLIKGYRRACTKALEYLREIQVSLTDSSPEERRSLLLKCAQTTLNSKLVSGYKKFFSEMVVDAVMVLDDSLDKSLIGIKKVMGGSVTDSRLVNGVAFQKTFSYAGFEQQPKSFVNPKVLLLNIELELKAERENAEIRISSPSDYQTIVDAEWKIIFNKLDEIVASGAQVVLSKLPIGDLATQYFADRNIFCAGRVAEEDLKRTAKSTGGMVQTTTSSLTDVVLGTCGKFEEIQIGSERYNVFTECTKAQSSTLILRGGADQFLEEAERSLNDAVMIVRRALKTQTVVGGGGAVEMELSRFLREHSRTISGKQQLAVGCFAKAMECIPKALACNSGLDCIDVMNALRQKHAGGKPETRWFGVDCINGGIVNTLEANVWEPAMVKLNALAAATEAACLVLSIDETVRNPRSNPEQGMGGNTPAPYGRGRGRGMRR